MNKFQLMDLLKRSQIPLTPELIQLATALTVATKTQLRVRHIFHAGAARRQAHRGGRRALEHDVELLASEMGRKRGL